MEKSGFIFPFRQFLAGLSMMILLLSLFSVALEGASLSKINLTTDDGLPQSNVFDMYLDSRGFLWLITGGGVVRYDGIHLKSYNPGNGYPFSLVKRIIEVKPDTFWLVDYKQFLWELKYDKVRKVEFMDPDYLTRATDLARFSNGDILASTDSSGGFYIYHNESWTHVKSEDLGLPPDIMTVHVSPEGRIFLGSRNNGVYIVEDGQLLGVIDEANGLPSNSVQCISAFSNEEVWVGTLTGLYIHNQPALTKAFNQQFPNSLITYIYRSNDGMTWISTVGTGNGLIQLKDGRFRAINGVMELGQVPRTNRALTDENGTLFIGTISGLSTVTSLNFLNYGVEDGLEESFIKGITRDASGVLWIGTKQAGVFYEKNGHFVPFPYTIKAPLQNQVMDLASSGNTVWVATQGGVVCVQDGVYLENPVTNYFLNRNVRFIDADNPEEIFITCNNGIFRYSNGTVEDITYNLATIPSSMWGLTRDKKGNLFCVTNGDGAWRLQTDLWVSIEPHLKDPRGIKDLIGLSKTREGDLLVCSKNGGFLWDGTQFSLIFGEKTPVWEMLYDNKGRLWTSTSNGLFFQTKTETRCFNRSMGFYSTEYNMRSSYMDSDGTLWFGGARGLLRYRENQVPAKIKLKPPILTKVITHQQTVYFPDNTESYSWKGTRLQFDFVSPFFIFPRQVHYRYKLQGLDDDYQLAEVGTETTAKYTNLPPGSYTFQVQSRIGNGRWDSPRTNFNFHIYPPWYRTIWAFLFYFLLAVMAARQFFFWRIRVLRIKNLLLEKKIDLRMAELKRANLHLENEITERKKVEKDLKEEKENLAITLTSIHEAVIRTNSNCKVQMLNREAIDLLELAEDEWFGKKLDEILYLMEPDGKEREKLDCQDIIHTVIHRPLLRHKFWLVTQGKGQIWVDLSGSKIPSEEREDGGFVFVLRNIDRQQKDEEELLNAQKLTSIGVLAGGIAHDFNNILLGIMGNAQLAQKALKENRPAQGYVQAVGKAAQTAKTLTQRLLTFAKGGAPIKEIFDVGSEIGKWAELYVRDMNIICRIEKEDSLWPILADKSQIEQVFHSLFTNSSQAMPGGGEIQIELKNKTFSNADGHSDCFVEATLRDTGAGIPEEILPKIFDPYFSTKEKCSGLGLSTSYSVLERHGGHISVGATSGGGAEFRLLIPATPDQEKGVEAEPPLANLKGKRILFMDDDPTIREFMKEALTSFGCEASLTDDGKPAIQAYKTAGEGGTPFDLVILDCVVPGGMGGEETVNAILDVNPKAKIIVSSGYSQQGALSNYKSYGFCGILPKPYRIEDLKAILNQLLE